MVSGISLPRSLRQPVFGRIALRMGMDLGEAAGTVSEYRCFRDLFARPLRDGLRPLDLAQDAVVSPVDGSVTGQGIARRGGLIQAKGIEYDLAELVASRELAETLDGGTYLTLYLRPRDYHRIHSPIDARLNNLTWVPGSLFPVQPWVVRNLQGLYVSNERVVFDLHSPVIGRMAMVCVAAAGVGNISVFDDTGFGGSGNGERPKPPAVSIVKGQEVARFNLGSTVIVVFPPGRVEPASLPAGGPIRMGQRVATILGDNRP